MQMTTFFLLIFFFANDLNFLCACRLFDSLAYSGRIGFFGDIGIVLTDLLFVVHFFAFNFFKAQFPVFTSYTNFACTNF